MTSWKTALALCLLLLATPALADPPAAAPQAPVAAAAPDATPAPPSAPSADPEQQKQSIHIDVDPEAKKANEAYETAFKALTAEQQEVLKKVEADYRNETAGLGVEAPQVAYELKYCAAKDGTEIAKDPAKYQSELGVYRTQLQTLAIQVRQKYDHRRQIEAPFMDQQLLERHYIFITNLNIILGEKLLELADKTGGFAKTDCGKLQEKLDTSFRLANIQQQQSQEIPPAKLLEIQDGVKKGDKDAMTVMAMMQIMGTGVPKDKDKGLALLTTAAEAGYERAQYMLGLTLGTELSGITPDKEKAKYWLGKAAAQGNQKAAGMLKIIDKMTPPESTQALRKKADAGNADAQYELGSRYSQGLGGTERDPAEALKWLLMAAGQGQPLAQSDVGVLLLNSGRQEEGLAWMTKAAEHGVVNSQYELATLYYAGQIVPKDLTKAADWAKKASAAGDSRATKLLEQITGK